MHIPKFGAVMNFLPGRLGALLLVTAAICVSACSYSGDIYRNKYRYKAPPPSAATPATGAPGELIPTTDPSAPEGIPQPGAPL